MWTFTKELKIKNPIIIEGLPGIGNCGKIAVDFLIQELDTEKVADFWTDNMPHSVFVNEDSIVELPEISLHYNKKHNLLLLAGDTQPVESPHSYEFCNSLLENIKIMKPKEILTLGGIGLEDIPHDPKVYVAGNSKKFVSSFKKCKKDLYGKVGPIMGVSGILVALAGKQSLNAAVLLSETYGHPDYQGIAGARAILSVLNERFSLKIKLDDLQDEISDIEEELLKKADQMLKSAQSQKTDYIG